MPLAGKKLFDTMSAFDWYAGTSGVARTPVNVLHLQFVKRVPKLNLSRNHTESFVVWGLCALFNDVLLLACGDAGLRLFSLNSSQLIPHKIIAIQDVTIVAFDAHTDTLLLLVKALQIDKWQP